jgi:acylphosphatase
MPTVHLQIEGRVQGVFYRATAKKIADQLGLNGWVRNMPGGSVEATVNGTEEAVAAFIDWCKKGPSKAVVENVIVTPKPDDGLRGFEVIK